MVDQHIQVTGANPAASLQSADAHSTPRANIPAESLMSLKRCACVIIKSLAGSSSTPRSANERQLIVNNNACDASG
jgi:hypothetical protein